MRTEYEANVALARTRSAQRAALWPRNARGQFEPHTGYAHGLHAYMQHNAQRAAQRKR